MSDPSPDELVEAERWLEEAGEELAVATLIASAPELPRRVVCFHAHLAAEKALKALQIRRGILVRKVHNLVELVRELPANDRRRFDHNDLNLLNPWTIDGRYSADQGEVDERLAIEVRDAADRVVSVVRDLIA